MFRTIYQHQSWGKRIQPIVKEIAIGKLSNNELIDRILYFQKLTHVKRTYSGKKVQSWNLKVLTSKYEGQLTSIFGKVATFLLEYEQICENKIPLFYSQKEYEYTFSKYEILLLMCMMTMCLVPPQEYEGIKQKQTKFNHLKNFAYIFSHQKFKTMGIIEYLKKELSEGEKKKSMDQKLTLIRNITEINLKDIVAINFDKPMINLKIEANEADIEHNYGCLKVDFANKYIGGGALIHGAVQEEIMFAVHPQMYTSMLLCEVIADNEAISYIGYKKYFQSLGYGFNVSITGWNDYKYEYDHLGRAVEYITAIDALNFPRIKELQQFSNQGFQREVMKAFTGFNRQEGKAICTGNWGCGVFAGDLQLKFLIQWFAASLCGKPLVYCPFGKKSVIQNEDILGRIGKMKVGQAYQVIKKSLKKHKGGKGEFYKSVYEVLQCN